MKYKSAKTLWLLPYISSNRKIDSCLVLGLGLGLVVGLGLGFGLGLGLGLV